MKTGPRSGKQNNGNRTTLWGNSTLDNTGIAWTWGEECQYDEKIKEMGKE
jgi:hypothetical protein